MNPKVPPEGSICFDCAMELGGKGYGVVTCWVAECVVCGEEKSCCSTSDYSWPDGRKALFD